METTNDVDIGQVVRSKAGRDKGKVFIVIDVIDDLYVLVVDGDFRRLDNPKKKKIRHLIVYKSIIEEIQNRVKNGEKINNAYIRKALEPFNKEI
ncbi:KOW domain-containing RNA-binding protein [Brassicibacter mesophilus]|jgi:ribosomal protein L14E/L6E/L27E|uniref:KOW domain-containing RNA-binding protein n=1 Tax=Brassicibacter mesophilus TaxID=745119 RepID=UPI003D232D9D